MFKPLSLFLALRYVSSRHRKGFSAFISASSTIGIALGVMVLIIVLSTMNGFQKELANKLLSIVPHAELIAVNQPINNWRKSVQNVLKNADVIAAAPVIKMEGLMQHGAKLKAMEIRGVDLTLEQQVSDIQNFIEQGSWQSLAQANGIIIGQGIAKKLKLKLGDQVQLLLPKQNSEANFNKNFPVPVKKNVTIVGIFKFGGTIDDTLAYMSLAHAAKMIGLQKIADNYQVHGIRLKVNNVFKAPVIAREVAYKFDHYAYIYDWTRSQGHLFSDIQLVRLVMFIVLSLVIAVASFNIVSTLVMVVNEKKGDIAILKTMGASPSAIMFTFIVQGMFNGVVGCVVGTSLGLLIAKNLTYIATSFERFFGVHFLSADVYFIDHLPSFVVMQDVYSTVTIALVLTIVATVYPAWQATKVEPANVLGQL
jgi:lipoprotein-releasing system permease protein